MSKFNPERMTRWPRLPWSRWPEWRPRWGRPEAEALAERVEELWPREPLPNRIARRLYDVARHLENLREGPARSGRCAEEWESATAKAKASREAAEQNARFEAEWRAALVEIDRALVEIEAALDAAAQPAPVGGDDAPGA